MKHHSIVYPPIAGVARRIPTILLEDGLPLHSFADFLANDDYLTFGPKTLHSAAIAVGLFADFSLAVAHASLDDNKHPEALIASFGSAIRFGTIGPDSRCPYDLLWKPQVHDWKRLITHVERYIAFCITRAVLATCTATEAMILKSGQVVDSATRDYGGLLAYTKGARRVAANSHPETLRVVESNGGSSAKSFPKLYVERMIGDACRRHRASRNKALASFAREYIVRDALAFHLLFGGGIRTSELFHIFLEDVSIDSSGIARVELFHPTKGAIRWTPLGQAKSIVTSRERYLLAQYNLRPRHLLSVKDPMWAGWKRLLLTKPAPHNSTAVYWIHPEFGRSFAKLHYIYLREIRLKHLCPDPYYFRNMHDASKPWTVQGFQTAWESALHRMGIEQSELLGTHPHGARHWYGNTAAELGIDPRIRQIMMHHRSVYSQTQYQKPTDTQINNSINEAHDRMRAKLLGNSDSINESSNLSNETDLFELPRNRTDPFGLESAWELFRRLK